MSCVVFLLASSGPGVANATERVAILAGSNRLSLESLEQALEKDGYEVLNQDHLWHLTGQQSALPMGALDQPPPSWWPKELADDWKATTEACMAAAGPPPYNVASLSARTCGQSAALVLKQRYLEHLSPDFVLDVSVHSQGRKRVVTISRYAPADTDVLRLESKPVKSKAVAKTTIKVARSLIGGNGAADTRTIHRHQANTSAPAAGSSGDLEVPAIEAVEWSKPCAKPLPAKLEVSPADTLDARMLVETWEATLAASGQLSVGPDSLACTFSRSSIPTTMSTKDGKKMFQLSGQLMCGGPVIRSVRLHTAPDTPRGSWALAGWMVATALEKWCK